jgi:hypothetical protein
MNDDSMSGRDVYLLYGKGPVQHFRAWDAAMFIESQVAQGMTAKEPYEVNVADAAAYRAEHRR